MPLFRKSRPDHTAPPDDLQPLAPLSVGDGEATDAAPPSPTPGAPSSLGTPPSATTPPPAAMPSPAPAQPPLSAAVAERVALLEVLTQRFIFDLGMLISGQDDNFSRYVAPAAVARLYASVQAFLDSRQTMEANFGEWGEASFDGDLENPEAPVRVVVDFVDRSTIHGATAPRDPIPMRLCLLVRASEVSDYRLGPRPNS